MPFVQENHTIGGSMGWKENNKKDPRIEEFANEITESLVAKFSEGNYKYKKNLLLIDLFLCEVDNPDYLNKEEALKDLQASGLIKKFEVKTTTKIIELDDPEEENNLPDNSIADLIYAKIEVFKPELLVKKDEFETKKGKKIDIYYSHTRGLWKNPKHVYDMRGKKYQKIFDCLNKSKTHIPSKILAEELGYSSIANLAKAIGKLRAMATQKAEISNIIIPRNKLGYKINPRYRIINKDKEDII